MSLPPTLESQSGNNPALETSFDMVGWGLIVSVGKVHWKLLVLAKLPN